MQGPSLRVPLRFVGRQWTEGVLGSCAASPSPGGHGQPRAGRRRAAGAQGPAWAGIAVDPSPRHLDAERGRLKWLGGLFVPGPLWRGAWRWFTASVPLNRFPGGPGAIRPGRAALSDQPEIKGGTGPFY